MAKGRPATTEVHDVYGINNNNGYNKEIIIPGVGHSHAMGTLPERPVRSGFVSKPAPPVRSGTDRKTSVSPVFVAKFAVGIETVGIDTFGMVSTDDTGDCVLVPDSMTS